MSASSTVSGPVAGPVTVKPEGTTVSGAGNGADDDDDEQDRPVVDGPSQHPQDSCCGCCNTTDTNSNSKTTCEQLLRQQKCEQVSAHYQRKFCSVVPLRSSSQEFRNLFTTSSASSSPSNQHAAPIWVDVRTAAERAVSIIAGAVTLSEWEADEAHDSAHQQLLQESPVIVYCTIGYRSGMEARRLQQRYPHLRIYNLDGIIAYSHVVCAAGTNNDNNSSSSPSPSVPWQLPPIVHPETGDAATHIHTFGKSWDFVNQRQYRSVHFGTVGTVAHMMRVGQRSMGCHVQTLLHHCGCCRRYRHHESGNGCSHRKEKIRIE